MVGGAGQMTIVDIIEEIVDGLRDLLGIEAIEQRDRVEKNAAKGAFGREPNSWFFRRLGELALKRQRTENVKRKRFERLNKAVVHDARAEILEASRNREARIAAALKMSGMMMDDERALRVAESRRTVGDALKAEIFEKHLSSEHPGWLGALVQHGHMVQHLGREYLAKKRFLNFEQRHFFKRERNTAPKKQIWTHRFAEFPPPVRVQWVTHQQNKKGGFAPTRSTYVFGPVDMRDGRQPRDVYEQWVKGDSAYVTDMRIDNDRFQFWLGWFLGDLSHEKIRDWIGYGVKDLGLPRWREDWGEHTRADQSVHPGDNMQNPVDRCYNWHANARWLVWAAEMWRLHSGWHEGRGGYFALGKADKADWDALQTWKRHCMTWVIGPSGAARLRTREMFAAMHPMGLNPYSSEINPPAFAVAELLRLTKKHTPVPGARSWGELENSVCDWTDGIMGSMRPEHRWPMHWFSYIQSLHKRDYWKDDAFEFYMRANQIYSQVIASYASSGVSNAFNAAFGEITDRVLGKITAMAGEWMEAMFELVRQKEAGSVWSFFRDVSLIAKDDMVNIGGMLSERSVVELKGKMDVASNAGWNYANDLFDDVGVELNGYEKILKLSKS